MIELGTTRYEEARAAVARAFLDARPRAPPTNISYMSATGHISLVFSPSAGPLDVIAKKIDENVDAVPRRR